MHAVPAPETCPPVRRGDSGLQLRPPEFRGLALSALRKHLGSVPVWGSLRGRCEGPGVWTERHLSHLVTGWGWGERGTGAGVRASVELTERPHPRVLAAEQAAWCVQGSVLAQR